MLITCPQCKGIGKIESKEYSIADTACIIYDSGEKSVGYDDKGNLYEACVYPLPYHDNCKTDPLLIYNILKRDGALNHFKKIIKVYSINGNIQCLGVLNERL